MRVDLKLNRIEDKVTVKGTVETTAKLSCSRCLETFMYPIDTDIDILYQPLKEKIREADELKKEDFRIATYNEPVLDFDDDIREAVCLAVPMKPLCREECQGLCPECGQNLNIARCECIMRSIDPRLAKLGKLHIRR